MANGNEAEREGREGGESDRVRVGGVNVRDIVIGGVRFGVHAGVVGEVGGVVEDVELVVEAVEEEVVVGAELAGGAKNIDGDEGTEIPGGMLLLCDGIVEAETDLVRVCGDDEPSFGRILTYFKRSLAILANHHKLSSS